MQVRFWGTRGSVAAPGPGTIRYGGNTSCVEVRSDDSLAILDCGTGARGLGGRLMAQGTPVRAHVLLTHFHWDHIQGFPFFIPLFVPGNAVHVYGAPGLEQGLEEALSGQMQYTYFPVRLTDLPSVLTFHEVGESTFQAGRFTVNTQYLNHTCPAVGYRLSSGGITVAYVTDHEPYWPHDPALPLREALVHPGEQRHLEFVRGADLLIHDAQYTAEEYPAKRGWGHSTVEYVVDLAVAAGVQRLALFHHDPPRDDAAVDALVERARARALLRGATLDIFGASEGLEVDLEERSASLVTLSTQPDKRGTPSVFARVALLGPRERRRGLRDALVEDGYRLTEAALDGRPADWLVGEPDLLIVMPSEGAQVVADVQRVAVAAGGRPVLAVLEGAVDDALLRAVGELATDVVVAPFGPPNLRARVRAALARQQLDSSSSRSAADERGGGSFQLLDRLSAHELDQMLNAATRCGFQPGERLFSQGDPPGGVYYVHSGLVRLAVEAVDGREITVGFAGPGDTVGEMSALDGASRSAAALALEPVDASYVPRDVFRGTLQQSPQASFRLLRLLVRRLRDVDQRLARGTSHSIGLQAGPDVDASTGLRRRLSHLQTLLEQLEVAEEQLDQHAHEVRTAYLRMRDWRQAIEALRMVTHLLSASRTPRGLHRQAVRTLTRLVSADAASLYLLAEGRVSRAASHGRESPAGWSRDRVPPLVDAALRSSAPQIRALKAGEGTRWTLAVPLCADGHTPGLLWLERVGRFSEDDVALAEVVAAATAVALRPQVDETTAADTRLADLAPLEPTLQVEMDRASRLRYPIGLLLTDARSVGEDAARRLALLEALRHVLRRTDVVTLGPAGVLGIILPGLEPEALSNVEAKVQGAVRQAGEWLHRGSDLRVSGTVVFPDDAPATDLVARALASLPEPALV